MVSFSKAYLRHAAYYADVLETANDRFNQGGATAYEALHVFDENWENIRLGQQRCTRYLASSAEGARLCSKYAAKGANLIEIRLTRLEQEEWLRAALNGAHVLEDSSDEAIHMGNLALTIAENGELDEAIVLHTRALEIDRQHDDKASVARDLGNLGGAYLDKGDVQQAATYLESALEAFRKLGDKQAEGRILVNIGIAFLNLEEPLRALAFFEESKSLARQVGDLQGEAHALGVSAVAYERQGERQAAEQCYHQQHAIAKRLDDKRMLGQTLFNLGFFYAKNSQHRLAINYAMQALKIFQERDDPHLPMVARAIQEWSLAESQIADD